MRPVAWFSLLKSGRFRIHPSRFGLLISISIATPFNTVMAGIQRLFFGRRLAQAVLHGPPVFIVGHWRSGTTMLHELMVRDERYSSPSTYQCFAPHHFLISQWFFRRFATWLLPGKRPMDNMAAGWDRPQEDEFALMNLGLPSPYRRIAFPNEGAVDLDYLDLSSIDQKSRLRWLTKLRHFFAAVSVSTGRPLIIKSPTHTGRIAQLAEAFPDAKFIHITRDPRALYPSTCRLWNSLDEVQAMQKPCEDDLPEYVIECFSRMYNAFHRDRDKMSSRRMIDISYEELTKDPVGTLQRIYDKLHLADFESVRPTFQSWVDTEHRGYEVNKHSLSEADETKIKQAWQEYFQRYGYDETQ
ncbi:Sulfotransferase domain protein [Rubripirellula obstinata]|uniref:Sulfotransferase domain protein n=2 Tax=Rubripirellula obstinata TaxID=406547 RepID=A0A5B1CGM2_9BACT|nr:Sulfotransferase domain protein [Rubripirellula obstinata]